jgi:N-acetylmuramoyl-L-alanine amidase
MTDKRFTVVLDPGHGGVRTGAQHNGIIESHYNLLFTRLCAHRLRMANPEMTVHMTRLDDVAMSLSERGELVQSHDADLAISIHVNAGDPETQFGAMSFYDSRLGPSSKLAAEMFLNALPHELKDTDATPWAVHRWHSNPPTPEWLMRARNVIELVSQEAVPTVLLELGFSSNIMNAEMLKNLGVQKMFVAAIQCAISAVRLRQITGGARYING